MSRSVRVPFIDLVELHREVLPTVRVELERVFESGAFVNGPPVQRFERAFAEFCDLYEVRGGPLEMPFVLPHGAEAALKAAIARFPHQQAGLEEYFRSLAGSRCRCFGAS